MSDLISIFFLSSFYNKLSFLIQFTPSMKTCYMRLLGILNILINLSAIPFASFFPPCPFGVLVIAIATLILIGLIEFFKKKLLIEKKEALSMIFFGFLIVASVFFLTLGLAVLVYLQQTQNKQLTENKTFNYLIWQQSHLTSGQTSVLSIGFYIGNCLTLSFYTRQYYLMFWVNSIIHIFRYLKSKIHHQNQALLSHLTKIFVDKNIKKEKCCLCLEHYRDDEEVTRVICGHIFHIDCIRLWVLRSNACPLCRKRVVLY